MMAYQLCYTEKSIRARKAEWKAPIWWRTSPESKGMEVIIKSKCGQGLGEPHYSGESLRRHWCYLKVTSIAGSNGQSYVDEFKNHFYKTKDSPLNIRNECVPQPELLWLASREPNALKSSGQWKIPAYKTSDSQGSIQLIQATQREFLKTTSLKSGRNSCGPLQAGVILATVWVNTYLDLRLVCLPVRNYLCPSISNLNCTSRRKSHLLRCNRIKLNPGQLILSVKIEQICTRILTLTVLHGQFHWNDLPKLYIFFTVVTGRSQKSITHIFPLQGVYFTLLITWLIRKLQKSKQWEEQGWSRQLLW